MDALSVADSLDAATDNIGRCYNLAKPFRTLLESCGPRAAPAMRPMWSPLFEDERFCQQLAENTDAERKRVYLQVYHAGREEKINIISKRSLLGSHPLSLQGNRCECQKAPFLLLL